jgi:hypothetical protein
MKIISFCVGVQFGLLIGLCAMVALLKSSEQTSVSYENENFIIWKHNNISWESPKLTDYREEFMRLPKT